MTGDRPKTGQPPRVRPRTGDHGVVAGRDRPSTGGRPATGGQGGPSAGGQGRPATGGHHGGVTTRRSARRAPYVAPARIVAGTRHHDGRVENVSEAGMMVSVPPGLTDRESVSVRFALPMTKALVSVPATVVWQLPSRPGVEIVGLEFALVDEAMRRELQRYVELVAPPDEGA